MRNHQRFSCFFVILMISIAFSQNMPFPQEKSYVSCIKPTNYTQQSMNQAVRDHYWDYKSNYLKASSQTSGGYYIESKDTWEQWSVISVSEALGYGMVITVLMAGEDSDARSVIDGLYYFYEDHKSDRYDRLMSWRVRSGESNYPTSSATDGDLDIAYALYLAHHQWGSTTGINYLNEARGIITDIKSAEVNTADIFLQMGNYVEGTANAHYRKSRPSDWMGDHLRAFAIANNDTYWNTIANNIYTHYTTFVNAYSDKTGLISDFVTINSSGVSPEAPNFLEGPYDGEFYMNACRVPWRFATDYAHYGTLGAKTACDKIVTWIKSATEDTPSKINTGYWLDGSEISNNFSTPAFIAPMVAACIVDGAHQSYLNKGWQHLLSPEMTNVKVYEDAIKLQSMLLISGNWWKPGDDNTGADTVVVDSNGVLFDDFENVFGDDPSQSHLGAANGYAISNGDSISLGEGYWYVFKDNFGSQITSASTIIGDNSDDMINGNELTISLKTSTSFAPSGEYPFAGIGCAILGDGSNYYNFSTMEGFTIRAKGSGTIRVSFTTQDINNLPDSSQWGYYGFDLALSTFYSDTTISVGLFAPEPYSPAAENGWGWNGAKEKVNGIQIAVKDSAQDATITIDRLIFNGMIYNDFGFTYESYDPVAVTKQHFKNKPKFFYVKCVGHSSVLVSYVMDAPGKAVFSLFDGRGRLLEKIVGEHATKGFFNKTILLNDNGLYIAKFSALGKTCVEKFSIVR